MKKIFKLLAAVIVFAIVVLFSSISNAEEITLDKLAEKLNNSSSTRYYEKWENRKFTARVNENKIEIVENDNVIFYYELNDNIISISLTAEDPNALLINLYGTEMIDIVGEFYGYDVGEASTMLPREAGSQLTLEDYGVVIESTSDTSSIMKIDINKKVPRVDNSDDYFKVNDLVKEENVKTRLIGEGKLSINGSKTNIDKYDLEDNKVVVCISEALGFTYQSYNTMLSVIEVMFDSKEAAEYFKTNYPSINLGDKEFPGFKIEQYAKVTPEEDDNILGVYMPFIRLTIDKNMVKAELEKDDEDEVVSNDNPETNTVVKEEQEVGNEIDIEAVLEDEVIEENESKDNILSEEEQLEQLIRTILILVAVLFVLLVLVLVRAIKRK